MDRKTLADRLVNYADAVAAFSVVNALTFIIGLTEVEVRCSLAHLSWLVLSGQVASSALIAGIVCFLRHLEVRVRRRDGDLEPDIENFLRGFFVARLIVVAVSAVLAVSAARMALSDPGCSIIAA